MLATPPKTVTSASARSRRADRPRPGRRWRKRARTGSSPWHTPSPSHTAYREPRQAGSPRGAAAQPLPLPRCASSTAMPAVDPGSDDGRQKRRHQECQREGPGHHPGRHAQVLRHGHDQHGKRSRGRPQLMHWASPSPTTARRVMAGATSGTAAGLSCRRVGSMSAVDGHRDRHRVRSAAAAADAIAAPSSEHNARLRQHQLDPTRGLPVTAIALTTIGPARNP